MNKRHKSLLKKWEGLCVLCGEPFLNKDSVTTEHLIPQSKGGSHEADNMGISHFRCNQIRGNLSLREAAVLIALRKQELGDKFEKYINESVPHRYPIAEGLVNRRQKRKDAARKERLQNAQSSTNSGVSQSQGSQENCSGEFSSYSQCQCNSSEHHSEYACRCR